MQYFIVNTNDELFKIYKEEIYKLRHKVFKEILNWRVDTVDGNKEIDYFDSLPNLHYVVVFNSEQELVGCIRLLPTNNDYMLEKISPSFIAKSLYNINHIISNPQQQTIH